MIRPFVCGSLAALALCLPATASALPSDPQIEALSPADGASVPAGPTGITVTFTCPSYVKQTYGDPMRPFIDRGDVSDYQVTFSDRPDAGPNGVLERHPFPSSTFGARTQSDGVCISELPGDYIPQALKLGRVYWQASRSCVGCTPQGEAGPVRSFRVATSATGTLTVPRRLYAGYLGAFTVRSDAKLSGARVALERRSGGRWRKVTDEPFRTDATELYGTLPAGRQTLRAVARLGATTLTLGTKTLTVRREGGRSTSRRDDGRYRDAKPAKNSTLQFTVAGGGRLLKNFKASVTTFCIGPTLESNRILIVFALLNTVRVAPDGTVVGILRSKRGGREVLEGHLRNGRLTGASIDVSLSTCNGERKFTAVRR